MNTKNICKKNRGGGEIMFWKFMVEIIVLFIPNRIRAAVRHRLRHFCQYIYVKKTAKSVGKRFCCGKNILISKRTQIGNDVSINGIFVQGCGNLKIGNYVQIGIELLVLTSNHNYKQNRIPYDYYEIPKDVIIDDFVWIGSRVTLLPGTHLGEGSIIQAGAVVRGEIPPYSIVGGNPAQVFAHRDKESFEKLKKEGKFYTNEIH